MQTAGSSTHDYVVDLAFEYNSSPPKYDLYCVACGYKIVGTIEECRRHVLRRDKMCPVRMDVVESVERGGVMIYLVRRHDETLNSHFEVINPHHGDANMILFSDEVIVARCKQAIQVPYTTPLTSFKARRTGGKRIEVSFADKLWTLLQ